MPAPVLVIGNKAYSSWSMRPWLALRMAGIPFDEKMLSLFGADWGKRISRFSRAGKVPVLLHGKNTIWDSLAIIEYAAENWPGSRIWPRSTAARAMARCVAAEMHSGFQALRSECPMNLRRVPKLPRKELSAAALADIARIESIWAECRKNHGKAGPFLFGNFTAADAMYAPVVARFHHYAVPVKPASRKYMDAVMSSKAYRSWLAEALAETEVIAKYEDI